MNVTTSEHVVSLEGELNRSAGQAISRVLLDVLRTHQTAILDCRQISRLSEGGVAALVLVVRSAYQLGLPSQSLSLRDPSEQLLEALEGVGLTREVAVERTPEPA